MTAGPLAGLRIIEVYCGMLLADLGAEVIKIENRDGDIARRTDSHSVGAHNVYFASLNRNKKSILLDLKHPSDRRRFEELVAVSDALITNLRPQAIRSLGLTYEALRHVNERIVCVALTGFGLNGPFSEYPAYDYIIQAMTGVMMLTGRPDAPPERAGYSIADNTGGMTAAIGLLAKIIEGRGGQVDVALYDTLLSQLNYLAGMYLTTGEHPERMPDGAHPFFVPAQIFRTRDGHMALFITHDSFWRIFAERIGRPDWIRDPAFATMEARSRNRERVLTEIQGELVKKTSDEWVDLFRPEGVVVAAIGTMADALGQEHTAARNMIVSIPTDAGMLRLVGNPIKIVGMTESFRPPPLLGEHEIPRERLRP